MDGLNPEEEMRIVNKDRRGELFYYMHQQIIARYNFERFSNDMNRVKPLNHLRQPIEEGYFPKLHANIAQRSWPGRFPNSTLQDVDRIRDGVKLNVHDLERWRTNVLNAIERGYAETPDGQRVDLTEERGIDIIANMIEPSTLSPNRELYGSIHNNGHVMMSFIHDPEQKFLESFGVMGTPETAMRDPVFYRWHESFNELFMKHKNLLVA